MVGGVGSPLPRSDLRCVGAVGAVVWERDKEAQESQ